MLLRLAVAVVAGALSQAGATHPIVSNGVRVDVPVGWHRVRPAPDAPVVDPRTVLVVGTGAVRTRWSQCQLTHYRVPPTGAVVVAVRWSSVRAAGGGHMKPGRWPLRALVAVRAHSLECFPGRAAAASLLLGAHPYQVNVLVGDRATVGTVRAALAVARSFARTG